MKQTSTVFERPFDFPLGNINTLRQLKLISMVSDILLWLSFGALTKIADAQVDERIWRWFAGAEYLTAIAYGAAGGFLLSSDPVSATAALAIIASVLLAGKAEHSAHQTALAVIFAVIALRGLPEVAWMPLSILVAAGVLDERMADKAKAGAVRNRIAGWFFSHRLTMDVAAVGTALLWQQPAFALAVILFDAGYQAVSYCAQENRPEIARGNHLVMDLFDCKRKILESEDKVRTFLSSVPQKIGMTKIAGPFVVKFVPKDPKKRREWGISGIVIIAESHVSVHTYPYKGSAKVDVYSCREFDREKTEMIISNHFGSKDYSSKLLLRALDEHLAAADKEKARGILEEERQRA